MRRVLNGASKFHDKSLNNSLLVGPDLLQNLLFVLMLFREHKYAVEGMQVGLLESDQCSLRFLRREDPTSDVSVFDYLGSVKDPETALTLSRSLVELLKLDGFNLTKFISKALKLSLKLNPVTDTLVVSRGVNLELKDSVTQRSVLSCVSFVFDPLGLVAPYTVRARLLLKDIWRFSGQ